MQNKQKIQETKQNIPQRSSFRKPDKDVLQFSSENNSNERFRSKSVTFNKAVILNLLQQQSEEEEDDEETQFENECEIIVRFNIQKLNYLATESYLDDTLISSNEDSECLELELDSTKNFDSTPKKSFLIPPGFMDNDEIDDIPLHSKNSIEEEKQQKEQKSDLKLISAPPPEDSQIKDQFITELETFSENDKVDRFQVKSLSYIESCFSEFSQYCSNNNCQIINSTTYSITMRKLPQVFFKFLLCCTHNKGGLVIRLQNQPGRKLLRLICVSGNNAKFLDIRNQIKCQLWAKGLIQLSQKESLECAVEYKKQKLNELKQEANYIRKRVKNQTVLEVILTKILETRDELFQIISHNYNGSAKAENMIDRPLYFELMMDIYNDYSKNDQQTYSAKRKKIVQTWTIQQCFQYLQVQPMYRIKCEDQIPYAKAMQQFQRLNYALSPLDKLNCIIKGYQTMKQCCQSSNLQLQTMDTILPLLIFIILRSDISNICANIKIVQNFINIKQQYKVADKMVTNVYVATEYIAISWDQTKSDK